jgi:uncharacterized protein
MNAARAALLALMLCWAFAAMADVAVPPLTGRVVDKTATLSSSDVASLDQTLKDFEARKGSQIAVLIVPTTQPETIEQYSLRVAEAWKIGRRKIDDGAILVIAKDDHKLRIEVGYGLEGALTDVTSKRIIDEVITPKFRSGDFAGGISDGVDRIIRVVDGEPLPAPAPRKPQDPGIDLFNPGSIFAMVFAGTILRAIFGRLLGSLATGGLIAAVFWFVTVSLIWSALAGFVSFVIAMVTGSATSSGGLGGGTWSGGGGSFSGGSSSGGSGGFSGGGGSFGGGGASGSW